MSCLVAENDPSVPFDGALGFYELLELLRWWFIPAASITPQCSTNEPPSTRKKSQTSMSIGLPDGGIPMNSPWCVAVM